MVCDTLASLNFRQVELIEKIWRGQNTDWLVRAAGPNSTEVLQPYFETEDGETIELLIAKEAKRRKEKHRSQPLKSEFRFSFPNVGNSAPKADTRLGDFHAKEFPPLVAKGALDTPLPDESDKEMEEQDEGKRARRDAPAPADAAPWLPVGARIVKNEGRGDCLFHAIADALKVLDPSQKASARSLRAFCCAFYKRHTEEYSVMWDGVRAGAQNNDDNWSGDFTAYIDELQLSGVWACYLECFALSTALRRSILVCTSKGDVWVFPHDESNGLDPICLFFNAAIQHYEFMDGPVAPELKRWAKKHGKERLTGGGAGSEDSLRLADFASVDTEPRLVDFASPVKSKRFRIWGKSAPSNHGFSPKTREVQFASPPRLIDVDSPPVAAQKRQRPQCWLRGSKFQKGAEKDLRWECPHCPFVIEADGYKKIGQARYQHNKTAHAGQYQAGRLRPKLLLQQLPPNADVGWQCPLCQVGLTVDEKNSVSNAVLKQLRAKHRRIVHPDVSLKQWRQLAVPTPRSLQYKQQRRIALLNCAPAKRQQFAPDLDSAKFEFFVWPFLVNGKTKCQKVSFRNAWRCRKCCRCFTVRRDSNEHECRAMLTHKCTLDRIAELEKLKAQQFADHGLDQKSSLQVVCVAIDALKGRSLPK